jgi:hypothetical protein
MLDWTPTPGEHTLRFSADVDNTVQESDETNNSFEVTIYVSTPPTADAGQDQTLDCGGETGTKVTLDGSNSSDPDSDSLSFEWRDADRNVIGTTAIVQISLPLGTHEFTLRVEDAEGGTDTDSVVIIIQDKTPPAIDRLIASPNTLWPPNHKMVPVTVSTSANDICSDEVTCWISNVTSNEQIVGDWKQTGDLTLNLRAEREGRGSGRIYTITVECSDSTGNSKTGTTRVTVPHDQGKKKK